MVSEFDDVVAKADPRYLRKAHDLLAFARDVLVNDIGGRSRWVVHRAADAATTAIRNAVDDGSDIAAVDRRASAILLRSGLASVRDKLNAGSLAYDGGGVDVEKRLAMTLCDVQLAIAEMAVAAEGGMTPVPQSPEAVVKKSGVNGWDDFVASRLADWVGVLERSSRERDEDAINCLCEIAVMAQAWAELDHDHPDNNRRRGLLVESIANAVNVARGMAAKS